MLITDYQIAEALAKLENISIDKADSIATGFKQTHNLEVMREYWNAKTAKQRALVIKKHWL